MLNLSAEPLDSFLCERRRGRSRAPIRPDQLLQLHQIIRLPAPKRFRTGEGRQRLGHGREEAGTYRSGLARSNWRNSLLPRSTAESSAVCAGFLPAKACSSSSSITPRIRTNDPRRIPFEFSVG